MHVHGIPVEGQYHVEMDLECATSIMYEAQQSFECMYTKFTLGALGAF